ncbi:MAG: hypothetical protein FIA95_16150, partial [Gemmatimonadetes bacterium]|nr:hypothetical protein [Gemmatimonadota bacterium]
MLLRLLLLAFSLGIARGPLPHASGGVEPPGGAAADTVVRADLGRLPRSVAAGLAAEAGAP